MDKKYFAFISYQRKDEKIAEWLRRKLENYHLPAKIRKGNVELPKDLRPIFRDSLELSGGFLAQEIEKALSDSRFLIVVCSPNSAKSPWVNKEVQFFIDQGREDCIIPYIVDGVPFSGDDSIECFPSALRSLQGERELLGISINELGRDASVIKVVSRMFGLSFDTLWQRHNREQKRKRILWAIVAVLLILISFFVSGYFFKVNREIKGKNKEILRARDKLLVSQSKYLASEAKKEYDNGNTTKALRIALYALPKDLDNPDRPYIADVEYLLRSCDYSIEEMLDCRININTYKFDFSTDSRYVASVSHDRIIRVWDLKTGKLVMKTIKHPDIINSISFSPCGQYIVSTSFFSLYKWDVYTGRLISENRYNTEVYSALFSPDGKYIVTASMDKAARVWDAETGKAVTEPLLHNSYVNSALFSPDGKYIVTASMDKTARVWDAVTGELMTEPLMHNNNVNSAIFSSDGKYIVTASDDNTARVWDATNGMPVTKPLQHKAPVRSAVFSLDGKYVVTASNDSTTRVWNTQTGESVTDILEHQGKVYSAIFSPDCKYIISVDDSKFYIWDVFSSINLFSLLLDGNSILGLSSDGKYLCVGNQVLNFASDDVYKKENFIAEEFFSLVFSPSGKNVVTTSWDNNARVWDVETGKPVTEPMLHNSSVNSAVFSPDGKYILTASSDSTACVWETQTGILVCEPLRHKGSVCSAVFSHDGKYILTASQDSTACVWDAETAMPVYEYKHSSPVSYAIFGSEYKQVITVSQGINVWDTKNSELLCCNSNCVNNIIFSPDMKYMLAIFDNMVSILDATTFKQISKVLEFKSDVLFADFTPDGKSIVIGCWRTGVFIFPFPPLQELIDKYRKDPENDWSLTPEEKEEYSLE